MGHTSLKSAKRRVSSEPAGVPAAQPLIALFPGMSCTGVTSIGSNVALSTISLPFGPRPLTNSDIAFAFGAVARITFAPPSFCNASAGFVDCYRCELLAPSFFCEHRAFRPSSDRISREIAS